MEVTIGTFNLNNLFSRYNFKGEIKAIRDGDAEVESDAHYTFGSASTYKIRTYKGRLVAAKKPEKMKKLWIGSFRWTWTCWQFRRLKISIR